MEVFTYSKNPKLINWIFVMKSKIVSLLSSMTSCEIFYLVNNMPASMPSFKLFRVQFVIKALS